MFTLGVGILCFILAAALIYKERRRFMNAIMLMSAIVLTIRGSYKVWSANNPPLTDIGDGRFVVTQAGEIEMLWVLFMTLLIASLGIYLIVNNMILLRKESLSLAHLLPMVMGIGSVSYLVYQYWMLYNLAGEESSSRYLWLSEINIFLQGLTFYVPFMILAYLLYSFVYRCLPGDKEIDYVVVLGAGISGDQVTPLLAGRLDGGIELYKKSGEQALIIVSGGQGRDEVTSEAQAMKNYLLTQGIAAEKIVMEAASTNTYENLKYSKVIIDSKKENAAGYVVTNNFHVLRAAIYARAVGLNAQGYGVRTARYYSPTAVIREAIAFIFRYKKLTVCYILMVVLYTILAMFWPQVARFVF